MSQQQMRDEVRKLLSKGDVKYVIGYEKGTYGLRARPSFAYVPEDADNFIFSPLCVSNLATYIKLEEKLPLPRGVEPDKRKIGIVVKGCDRKAVTQLLNEKIIPRTSLVLIGLPCRGVIDPKKIDIDTGEVAELTEEKDKYIIAVGGKKKEYPKEKLLADKCKVCTVHTPPDCDVMLGEKIEAKVKDDYEDLKALESKSLEERWKYWEKQFKKCIRCYACRDVCPMCYCKDCILTRLKPQWIRRSVNLSENAMYHLLRAYHLAGRCVDCSECSRVCPVGIPIRELNRKFEKEVADLFGFKAGVKEGEKPVLATFKPNDPEEFII